MPKFSIKKSIDIKKSKKDIIKFLSNYKKWEYWSPWLIMERDAKITYSGIQEKVGAGYSWEGKLVGVGNMELLYIDENSLRMKLNFKKPFKSQAAVTFSFKSKGNLTSVTWGMDSHLPFYLFCMVKSMKAYIGMDYERGLNMLKEYLETYKVSSSVTIDGVTNLKKQKYFGIESSCSISIDDLSSVMSDSFGKLNKFQDKNKIKSKNVSFTIYHSWDLIKKETKFITCFPYEGEVDIPPAFVAGVIEDIKVVQVTHKGSYLHLANAWSTAFAYARANKIKTKKKPIGIEFYLNPHTTKSENLLTEVCMPLK
jgi:effector-binding domain-containing protein